MLLRWLFTNVFVLGVMVARTCDTLGLHAEQPTHRRRRRADGGGGDGEGQLLPPGSDPRIAMMSGALSFAAQLIATVRWTDVGARLRTATGAANIASCLGVELLLMIALPALAPRAYARHCRAVAALTRAAYWSLPLIRDPLDVMWVFQSTAPSPRLFGLIVDVFTLALGARALAMLLAPVVAPTPLLPHLALTAFAVERARTTEHMCSCAMLRHPIWGRRIAWVHRVAGALPLLAPDASTATPTAAAGSPEAQQALHCRIFLTAFLLLVGGVAPTLLLAKLLVPMEAAAAAARGSRQQPAAASAAGAGEQRGGPLKRAGSRCLGWLRRAAEVGEAAGLHLCRILLNAVGSPLLTCMAWWVMASLVWVTALVLEQPHLALGLPGSACAAPGSGAS